MDIFSNFFGEVGASKSDEMQANEINMVSALFIKGQLFSKRPTDSPKKRTNKFAFLLKKYFEY